MSLQKVPACCHYDQRGFFGAVITTPFKIPASPGMTSERFRLFTNSSRMPFYRVQLRVIIFHPDKKITGIRHNLNHGRSRKIKKRHGKDTGTIFSGVFFRPALPQDQAGNGFFAKNIL